MGTNRSADDRIPLLYLAPWVDIGGSDTATIDWFRFLPQERFQASLATTQPSPNRRLSQVAPYARELWELPQLMSGPDFPRFILSFIHTRGIRIVHVMNSRLGFDLLPDIASLPARPRVVVQFHGEEPNRSGYVPYVATRYGNLVDGFSLTTSTLDGSLDDYDVPIGKRRLIPIGVDAEREFSPRRVGPVEGLDPGKLQILFAARLTAQKDPLLMLEVAAQLKTAGLQFQIHVLGDGELEGEVAQRRAERGLQQDVLMHGACVDLAPWYAACDLVLMTSAYETSPARVAHEAMAMAVPVVAPQMAALEELITPQTGVLVEPPEEAEAYARAIRRLAADPERRRAIGEAARERVRSDFTLERMAEGHCSLYEELLSTPTAVPRPTPPPEGSPRSPVSAPFTRRRSVARPLVSVIVTCFNQGRYLAGCLSSVAAQTYQPIETIVVDDCSTEAETLDALAAVEREGSATVVRLAVNRGPSAARNAGIERAQGRYVLPLDCDDLLLEGAVTGLVGQLERASAETGFIYPNLRFFGNRADRLEMPSYNLHGLLTENHCPVSSLFDREVFDRGLRYPEEITLGDEDWDFVLTLAEHGIYGEAAESDTLLCRKHGFTRCDLVDVKVPFAEILTERHPGLFAQRALIKGEWNPSLTIVALDAIEADGGTPPELLAAAAEQTSPDFELILTGPRQPPGGPLERRLRCLPGDPDRSRAQILARSLELARGRYVLASYGCPTQLLGDPALVEKLLRVVGSDQRITALALAEAEGVQMPLRLLDRAGAAGAALSALCWDTTAASAPPASHRLPGARPLEALARWLGIYETVQWRHWPRADSDASGAQRADPGAALGEPRHRRARDAAFRQAAPELPQCPPGVPHRLETIGAWMPAQVRLLYRHLHHPTGRYRYTNHAALPAGCTVDHLLGCVRALPFPGTIGLRMEADVIVDPDAHAALDDPTLLGFADQEPLALLDELRLARHPQTGQRLLIAGEEDPLAALVHDPAVIGYIEPHPLRPRLPEHVATAHGMAGLLRSVDLSSRRHRYALGQSPGGLPAGELGALLTAPLGDCDPLWIDPEGRVFSVQALPNGRPSALSAMRWVGDPLTWTGFSHSGPKLRASARRVLDSARILAAPSSRNGRPAEPVGYLLRSEADRTVALHAAVHPVTGDQLLTTEPAEIEALGYRYGALLGYLLARAPVTGRLGPIRPAAPWAARFGQVPLAGEDGASCQPIGRRDI